MGGMIAQCLAVRHPERVLSLTSIMSTTGEPGLLRPTPEAVQRLMTPVPVDRDAAIEHWIATQRVIGGNGFAFDEQDERERFGRSYDRAFHPEGGTRQLAAIMASGPRREALRAVKQPALVIHGEEDPLVPVEGGIDTHEALGDSELLLIGGLGHSLPRPVWIPIADAIAKLAQRVP
jgi:pimeloyl-ACP methyl ester carboxylesterase